MRSNSSYDKHLKLVSFYLPQFHPIPENDEWWGPGFTEWRKVVQGRPRFPGHYQPHLPRDLGFYDLRTPETRAEQARLASEYGVHGFCYYHYWFNGKQLLESPVKSVLQSGEPIFPFCLCWANENWTRAWDGRSREVLISQEYSEADDLLHLRSLAPYFADSRYIRMEGKPIFLVYRTALLPEPKRTADLWRTEALRLGIGELFLISVENDFSGGGAIDPRTFGFDAAVDFQPNARTTKANLRNRLWRRLKFWGGTYKSMQYSELIRRWEALEIPAYPRFDCVTPMWDNSVRRERDAFILTDSNPELFRSWLEKALLRAQPDASGMRWTFINAWNEWAEGNHLEPCLKWERRYLEAVRDALLSATATLNEGQRVETTHGVYLEPNA